MTAFALALSFALGAPPAVAPSDAAAAQALERFFSTWQAVHAISYRLTKRERLRSGEERYEEALVKLRRPKDIYLAALVPKRGQEVIYRAQRDAKRLIVHPGRFPDVTLRLDVQGSLATSGQHHLVTHNGFDYTISIIRRALTTLGGALGGRLEHRGEAMRAGRKAELVVIHSGSNAPTPSPARSDENLFAFAERVGCDPYLLFSMNPSIEEVSDTLAAGERYLVPSAYGQRMELWLDADRHLPVEQTVFDFEGRLYERYEYLEMAVDPPLSDLDFDPDNPAYGF